MSVIAQSSEVSLEIIVGDDQSDDGSSAIIEALAKKYPDLIRYFRHPQRLGGCENYRFVMQQAKGQFIAHLDGDDFWLPGKLAAQIRFMEKNPDCPAVYSNAVAINDNGMVIGVFNNLQSERHDINSLLRRGNFLNHSSMLYRASLRQELLKLPLLFLDYLIHLRHTRHGAIGYLNQALVAYRVNSTSSIIIHANDQVRHFYWEALLDPPCGSVNADDLASGMAEFARSIFFRSCKIKNTTLLQHWLPIILSASPVGKIKMITLIVAAISRIGFRELMTWIYSKISGNYLKIIYYR